MDEFTQKMVAGLLLIASGLAQHDDELTDAELSDFGDQLGVFVSAVEYEQELRQEARDSAGSHPADLNNAVRT